MELAGAVAVVTGASSGIGEATAWVLASRGATVVASARRVDRLEHLVEQIHERGLRFELAGVPQPGWSSFINQIRALPVRVVND